MNIHLNLRPYTCGICGKGFTQPTHLNVHKRTHDGSKPYMCSVCGKTFAIASSMRKHLAIHDRENTEEEHRDIPNTLDSIHEPNYAVPDFVPMTNHPCQHCEATFPTKRELLSHLAGHAEINPFHCLVQDCQLRFPSQEKLAVHERRFHGKQHTCSYCGRYTNTNTGIHANTNVYMNRTSHTLLLLCKRCL